MRRNKYTYVFYEADTSYWFNGISKAFFTLPRALGKKVESALSNPNILLEEIPDLYNKLKNENFIVNNEYNELEIVHKLYEESINNKDYMLILLPTLNCNFKCWYCIQDHIQSIMDKSTIEKVMKHIKYMVCIEKITSLNLSWFGGEPFIYFNEVIIPITQYAQKLCNENNVKFINSATTNAALINYNIAEQLESMNFTHFQITLDGIQEEHDKVKYQIGMPSAFNRTLSNINNILNKTKNTNISLRINYTQKNLNLKIVEQVNKLISEDNRKRINVFFRKVWQETNNLSNYELCRSILELFQQSGYTIDPLNNIITDFKSCYVCKKYYHAINFNGGVFKCTASNEIYEDPKGHINNDGSITLNKDYIRKYNIKSFDNNTCSNCIYLPICMGNCPRNYNPKTFSCQQDLIDYNYKDIIINYIKHYLE